MLLTCDYNVWYYTLGHSTSTLTQKTTAVMKKVLVISKNAPFAKLLAEFIHRKGMTSYTAVDYDDADLVLGCNAFACVFVEVGIDYEGITITGVLKARFPDLRIIVTTVGHYAEREEAAAKENGAEGYLFVRTTPGSDAFFEKLAEILASIATS